MKIHELTLYSTNLENQQRVYQERLGFDCNRPDQHRLTISAGETTLNFVHSARQFYYHYCFLVPTGCMESICDFLDERDFKALPFQGERIVDFGNGKSVYFLDGDGSIAEFIERPSLGLRSKPDFEIDDVIRLNEIGIPTENPIDQSKEFVTKFGIELLENGLRRDDFVWCGDYEGVFLMPAVGRNWMPCDKPAEKNSLSVRFSTKQGEFTFDVKVD